MQNVDLKIFWFKFWTKNENIFRKLTQYAPSESGKIYEKALTRKSNSIFDPKATMQKLRELPQVLTEEDKKDVIRQYLNVSFPPKKNVQLFCRFAFF